MQDRECMRPRIVPAVDEDRGTSAGSIDAGPTHLLDGHAPGLHHEDAKPFDRGPPPAERAFVRTSSPAPPARTPVPPRVPQLGAILYPCGRASRTRPATASAPPALRRFQAQPLVGPRPVALFAEPRGPRGASGSRRRRNCISCGSSSGGSGRTTTRASWPLTPRPSRLRRAGASRPRLRPVRGTTYRRRSHPTRAVSSIQQAREPSGVPRVQYVRLLIDADIYFGSRF